MSHTPPRHHTVITGTGRAGTTFLVELLTLLGLDTGFNPRELAARKSAVAQAGLELDVRRSGTPYVVKSPAFCDHAEQVYARRDIVIDRGFVPMRSLFDKLQPVLQGVSFERFERVHRQLAQPALVHHFEGEGHTGKRLLAA